ncbi:MAG: hypothetical protein ACYSYV_05575 [Planctomycetota bacterium]
MVFLQIRFKDRIHPLTQADAGFPSVFQQLFVLDQACRIVGVHVTIPQKILKSKLLTQNRERFSLLGLKLVVE